MVGHDRSERAVTMARNTHTEVLAKRHAINQTAREANPARWSGKTRNWTPIGTVSLNPERELQVTVVEPEKQVA
jgi:hypothetical protein